MTDVKLQQSESFDFSVVNDFRQIGIVRSPYSYGTTSNFTGSTARQTYAIKLASNSGTFQVDEKISQTIAAVSIASASVSSNKVTINTSAAHKLATGQTVKITNGTFAGGVYVGTLANNGVRIAPYHDQASAVSNGLNNEIQKLKSSIINGFLSVKN